VAQPTLVATLRALWQEYTAGDPMREGVLWTNLSLRELSRRLLALGTPARRRTIRRLLSKRKVGRRTARKKKTMGHHPDRNAPCENIARLRREYEASGEAGRTFQCGEGWHSNENAVRFGIPSPRVPKETDARCYASRQHTPR
jgi:hypothetical protein